MSRHAGGVFHLEPDFRQDGSQFDHLFAAEERARNIHVHDGVSEADFVRMRTGRDATLEMPALILPAVQIDIRAGELPAKDANGVSYLKIPLNAL